MTICLENQITSNYQEELSSLLFNIKPFRSSTYPWNERHFLIFERIYMSIVNEKSSKRSIDEHVII